MVKQTKEIMGAVLSLVLLFLVVAVVAVVLEKQVVLVVLVAVLILVPVAVAVLEIHHFVLRHKETMVVLETLLLLFIPQVEAVDQVL